MKIKLILNVSLIVFILGCTIFTKSCAAPLQEEISIIPVPVKMERTSTAFVVNKKTRIFSQQDNREALRISKVLAEKLNRATGLEIETSKWNGTIMPDNVIYLTTDNADSSLGNEGYQLSVSNNAVVIKALHPAGLFYGMQTVIQLLPAEIESNAKVENVSWRISGVEITDYPRFKWRGMHLDVCRHFMPIAFIKKYIDYMAIHKLNVFHWHITDDQGWRLEIKKYPKLTQVGAWRKETLIGHEEDRLKKFDGIRYGGFYTQDEAREIVQYAKERFIKVVPEIEMPGHATAAIASYPWLGVTGKQIEVATSWGIFPDIYNLKDSTFSFLENVLSEVMDIFPSEYIHIGGDEAIKDQWKASKKIQQKIKELGLKNEDELQSYFITRIEKYVNAKGRKIIGWDEILEGGLAPNAAVMSWRGIEGGIAAARSHHDVIMAPIQYTYFWWNQGDPKVEPLSAGEFLPLEKVYQYEPVPDVLSPDEAKYIMGVEACAWTEYMEDSKKVEYMVFPRMSALAEVAWSSKEDRDWRSFIKRMNKQFKRYYYMGINYAKVPLDIGIEQRFY